MKKQIFPKNKNFYMENENEINQSFFEKILLKIKTKKKLSFLRLL